MERSVHDWQLDWTLLDHDFHRKTQAYVKALNKLYVEQTALHQVDFSWEGFRWIDFHDADQGIVSFDRRAHDPQTSSWYKPRDKAKVEQSVPIAERWILARLRNRRFLGAVDLNVAMANSSATSTRAVEGLRREPGRIVRDHRQAGAEAAARRALRLRRLEALPRRPRLPRRGRRPLVSAPFRLIKELVDVRIADKTVEIFHKGQRVASHPRTPSAQPHDDRRAHAESHRRHGLGRRPASSPSPIRSARRPPRSSRRSWPTVRIPNRASNLSGHPRPDAEL